MTEKNLQYINTLKGRKKLLETKRMNKDYYL